MHLKGLDLNVLVALDALLEHCNVTRAAEELHVSQSAMSGSLARLRLHFDDLLLVQLGRRMRRTSLGDELVAPVRSILVQIEAVVDTRPTFDPAASSRMFRVMASDYGATVLVAELLRRIRNAAPNVGVEIIPFSDSPLRSLAEGQVDTLIIAREYLAPDHPSQVVFEDNFVCVVWSHNALIKNELSLEQFLSMGHAVVKYGKQSVAHIEEKFFKEMGARRRVEVVVTSFNSLPHMIVGTNRVAVMHSRLARIYSQTMPLKLLAPPVEMPHIIESMQWHGYRQNDPASVWFRGQIISTAAALLP